MSWRTVIISSRCKLDYKMGYLVVREEEVRRIFLEEIAVLMIENPAISLTGCLLEALTEKKVKVIFCDSEHNPQTELVPLHGSHNSSERIRKQIQWTADAKALVWQRIIQEKIRRQASLLSQRKQTREAELLLSYIEQVQPADATNREGHAAKVYFNALFGMKFTRGADTPVNAALNYGYSILLSVVNREVALNGYLTQIGIFHDNMYNHFNLSCDLMEPFRFLIDSHVCAHPPEQFTAEQKHELWRLFHQTVSIHYTDQTVLNAIRIYCRSVFDALNRNDASLIYFLQQK